MDKYNINIDEKSIKYVQVYNHIKNLIIQKKLKFHEKLPPIRKLSKHINVNNTTIVKAYELLEKEGYVYKSIGSGTFISFRKEEKKTTNLNKVGVIQFDSGNPSSELFPINDFKKAINMTLSEENNSIFEYDEGLGDINLREKVAEYLKCMKIHTTKDNIQIISGAQQGIDIVCKGIINYLDIVFVEEPTYNGAIQVFKSKGAKIISIPMLDDGIDIGILKLKLEKTRPKLVYTMPNFQNPTGISYSSYKKKKLIELAEKYDFYIVEDDFISDFKFDSNDNRTIKSYDDKNRVIYIKSFSKLLMPGLRLGIIEVPDKLLDKILWAKYSSDISTPGLIQKSMYNYMEYFNWNNHLKIMEKIYTNKYRFAKKLIYDKLGDKLKIRNSNGGINFFIELPNGYLSKDFINFMLKKGVALLPGTYFFDNITYDSFFRINIANTSISELEKGISIISNNLDDFLKKYKKI